MNATMTPYALSQISPYPLSREEHAARMAGVYPDVDMTTQAYGYPDAPDTSGGTGADVSGRGVPDTSHGGIMNRGGPVNMQEGGEIDNADTDLESRLGPMGVIRDPNGAPGPSRGGAGVSDDLTMEVPVGSYVLNADAVERIGSTYINDKIKEAYDVALASGQEVPANYNPEDKVVIRISNGEALIPKPLVGPIGQRLLEKWNNEGLKVRANRKQEEEKMMAQQKLQGPQVASEAPPVQPQSPMQAQMGGLMGYNEGSEVGDSLINRIMSFILGDDSMGDVKKTVKEQEAFTNIIKQVIDESKFTPQEIEEELNLYEKAEGGTIPSFKNGGFLEKIYTAIKDNPLEILGYAGREVAGLAGFTIDDKHRARKIWNRYHGKKPTIKQGVSFGIHQNLYGNAPKEEEIQRILNEVVQDYTGDQNISTSRLKDSLYRTALHESLGGKYKRQIVAGKPVGVARGWWQVEPSTAMSMLTEGKDQGFIGPKVEQRLKAITGKTFDELKNLMLKDKNNNLKFKTTKGKDFFINLLENNQKFNATMASLNTLVKLKNSNDLDLLRD